MHTQDSGAAILANAGKPLLSQPPHQLPRITVQPPRYTHDVVEAEVALAALDLTDVGPVEAAALGQLLLGQLQLLAAQAYPSAEFAGDGRERRLGAGVGHQDIS